MSPHMPADSAYRQHVLLATHRTHAISCCRFIFWALWKQEASRINAWRKESLGLPDLNHGAAGTLDTCPDIPVVMMCSKHIIPGQRPPADWGSNCHVTGFAFPPQTEAATVDQRLKQFIEAQPDSKPIYLGFGSMPGQGHWRCCHACTLHTVSAVVVSQAQPYHPQGPPDVNFK